MAEPQKWIGRAQYLFIPLVVTNVDGYFPPPPNYREFVQRRLYYDANPTNGLDRSLSSYFSDISYGRASLNARVSDPVTINGLPDTSMTLAAIEAQPNSHLYEYIAVIYPSNTRSAGGGMAQPGTIEFNPPRSPNRTKARSRFLWNDSTGTWAMEIIHNVTRIGDYYNGVNHPAAYDEMAQSVAVHPTVYTKLLAGWIDPQTVPSHSGPVKDYALHSVALPHPPSDGRFAGVKVQAPNSNRYLVIEARLKSDRWDRGFLATKVPPEQTDRTYPGIDAEGVIVYEFSPEADSWPRANPNGPWPPLEMRAVLSVGQSFTHFDPSTTTSVKDHRTGIGRSRTIEVKSAIVGGYVVEVLTDAPK